MKRRIMTALVSTAVALSCGLAGPAAQAGEQSPSPEYTATQQTESSTGATEQSAGATSRAARASYPSGLSFSYVSGNGKETPVPNFNPSKNVAHYNASGSTVKATRVPSGWYIQWGVLYDSVSRTNAILYIVSKGSTEYRYWFVHARGAVHTTDELRSVIITVNGRNVNNGDPSKGFTVHGASYGSEIGYKELPDGWVMGGEYTNTYYQYTATPENSRSPRVIYKIMFDYVPPKDNIADLKNMMAFLPDGNPVTDFNPANAQLETNKRDYVLHANIPRGTTSIRLTGVPSSWKTTYNDCSGPYRCIMNIQGPIGSEVSMWFEFTDDYIPSYTVSFDSKGGQSVAPQYVKSGATITKPQDPYRKGYIFRGWSLNGTDEYALSTPVTGPLKLQALWDIDYRPAMERIAGNTRYDTMSALVSKQNPSQAGTLIVASGENYPDALAASSVAGALHAPILLTAKKELSLQALQQVNKIQPSTIIIVGGSNAVSANAERSLKSNCGNVQRVYGATRVDTALALYRSDTRFDFTWSDTAIVTTADNYADALSMSAWAYRSSSPIFLVSNKADNAKQIAALKDGDFSDIVIAGGTQAVNKQIEQQIADATGITPTRLSGETRYDTSIAIAKWLTQYTALGVDGAVFATGQNYPDALAAGPLAGAQDGLLILVNPADPSSAVNFLKPYKDAVQHAYVAGGTNALGENVTAQIADILNMQRP